MSAIATIRPLGVGVGWGGPILAMASWPMTMVIGLGSFDGCTYLSEYIYNIHLYLVSIRLLL
jgi:hypothetical protein